MSLNNSLPNSHQVVAGNPLRSGAPGAGLEAALMGTEEHQFPDLHSASLEYATRFEGAMGRFFLDMQRRALERNIDRLRKSLGEIKTAVDVGGGHGQTAIVMAQLGINVTVVGSREDAFIALDRDLNNLATQDDLSKRITKVIAPLFPLPFAASSFDLSLSFRIVPHLVGWPFLLAELARVATKGVIFDYPSVCSVNRLGNLLFPLKRGAEKSTRPYIVFNDLDIANEMASHGCVQSGVERQFVAPMALYRALRSPTIARLVESCASISGATARIGSPVVGLYTKS